MPPKGPVHAGLHHIERALSSVRHIWDFPSQTHTELQHSYKALFTSFGLQHIAYKALCCSEWTILILYGDGILR